LEFLRLTYAEKSVEFFNHRVVKYGQVHFPSNQILLSLIYPSFHSIKVSRFRSWFLSSLNNNNFL
jgi:hypothetical protein